MNSGNDMGTSKNTQPGTLAFRFANWAIAKAHPGETPDPLLFLTRKVGLGGEAFQRGAGLAPLAKRAERFFEVP